MTSLIKHCPACGHANDPAEIYCGGLRSDGSRCQYNLLDVEASPPAVSGTPKPAAEEPPAQAQANESGQLSCRNGHPLSPTDQLCLICGAEPSEPDCSKLPCGLSEPEQHQSSVEHLGDLSAAERQNPEVLRSVLAQGDALLFNLQRQGRYAPDLSPERLIVSSREPLRLTLAPGSERLDASTGGDLSTTTTSGELGRYAAPERLVGIQAPSSDWWNLGLVLLELMVGDSFWQDIHPQAWQLQVITDGVLIPTSITDPWRTLLRGLLTRDPQSRWSHSEIIRWLDGDEDIPLEEELAQGDSEGTVIRLAGQRHRNPARYALAAAQADRWDEALGQLQQGELLTWLQENNLASDSIAEVKRLAADESLDPDERLMLVLTMLNPSLPLCLRGELIGAGTLPADPQRSQAWLAGDLPSRLRRIDRHTWLADLAARRDEALQQARSLRLNLDEPRFEAAALIADRRRMETAWALRRQEWPAALHNGLSNLISRGRHSEEHLLLLLSAQLDQFRSAADVLQEAQRLAARAKIAHLWDEATARRWLSQSHRDIFRALQDHLADFVRCGLKQPDDWADQFRSDQRLPLEQALILLAIPAERWVRPEGGEHWQRLLQFFRRRVLASIQRGPLLALSIRAGGKRVDLAELTGTALPASSLINHLVSRQAKFRCLDPDLLESNPALNQRLRRLRQEADAYQRETGIPALYLGYPLLLKRDGSSSTTSARKAKLIPLLLWPVRLGVTAQGSLPQLGFDRDRGSGDGIRLNPALEGVLSARQYQELQDALEELQQRTALTGSQVIDVLGTVFPGGEGILERCPQNPSLPEGSDQKLQASGVLFLCSFSAQTLAHELEQLERRPCLDGPTAALLRLSVDGALPLQAPSAPEEHERFLVSPADPSQKRAVWASRQQPGVLIQGPPGTGKSQTIVNIVADALGRHERVLVVCQKQAALEVVRNRLEAAQLGERLCLITDPSRDRRSLIKKLREELEAWDPSRRRDQFARERQAIAGDVARLESELDGIYEAMATPIANSGLNDQEVIDGLLQLGNDPNIADLTALRPLLQRFHVEEIRTISRQCSDIASLWLRAQPEESPLHVLRVFSTDEGNLNAFYQAFEKYKQIERERSEHILGAPEILETQDPMAAQSWINSYSSMLYVVDVGLAALFTRWLPLFSDGTSEIIRERLASLDEMRRLKQEPGAMVKWQVVLESLKNTETESLLRAATEWSSKQAYLFACLTHEATNTSTSAVVYQAFSRLADNEKTRFSVHDSTAKVLEVSEVGLVQSWLDSGGSRIAQVNEEVASRFPGWFPLFDDHNGTLIRERLAFLGAKLQLNNGQEVFENWLSLLECLSNTETENLLYATRKWRPKQALLFSRLIHEATNPALSVVVNEAFTCLLNNEKVRGNLLSSSKKILETSNADLAQTWLDSCGPKIIQMHADFAIQLSQWAPLFNENTGKQIRERLAVIGKECRTIQTPASIVKWNALLASLELQQLDTLVVASREWQKCQTGFASLLVSPQYNYLKDEELSAALKRLVRSEQAKSAIESSISDEMPTVRQADLVDWLNTNKSHISDTDHSTALLLAHCLRLRESSRWSHIRNSLREVKSSLEWHQPVDSGARWDAKVCNIGDDLLLSLLLATQSRKQWMRSPSRIFRPTYLRSKAILKSIFPESVATKDTILIASLEQALEYEIQLRQDCRQYEQILRDLGLFEKVSNIPHHELLTNVDALIQQLDDAETILDAVSRCPLRQEAEQAIRSGRRDQILEFLDSLNRGIKRQHHRQQSLQTLQELSVWCRSDWLSDLEQKIKSDLPIISELDEVFATWSSLVDAEKTIVRFVPEFVENKDANQIATLKQALEYEIQLRQDCRSFELIRGDLGFSQNCTLLSQHDLLSAIRILLEKFDQVASIVIAIRECPLQIYASDVVRRGKTDEISAFIRGMTRGVRRQELRHSSRSLLNNLSPWCEQDWLEMLERRIDCDQSASGDLEAVAEGFPMLVDYQLYRIRSRNLSTNEQSVMRVLATVRSHWQAVAPQNLATAIRITIEREALLGWRAGAEAEEPALLLTRQDMDRRIKRLAEQDARLLDLNRRITATPAAPERVLPRPSWDDIVMLQGPRARKLREVVELGEERGLFELCPVWLANPETVSQIFPLRQGLFDLVIFDEASQLPVENALPAMYRGNRIVISGDEKQLPPTRFFSSGFADDSDDEITADEEVEDPDVIAEAQNAVETRRQVKDCGDLLQLASAAGLTHVSLDIHYRSRFRPLIAHSNAAFYQNKLSIPVLHPADEIRRSRPLQVELVNGIYANQSNRDEAIAVVDFLNDLWCGPVSEDPEALPTVGVVTFNKNQADLIEDFLDRCSLGNPRFQQVLERERQRRFNEEDCGFFVKNLENVQGDERDWILFSTTFGRDESERFRRYFGALGQKGGERRLNVATSRARDKVVIFSSMPIEEISDAHRQRKTPQQPRDFLQSYLLYAQAISEGHIEEAELLLNRLQRSKTSQAAAIGSSSQRFFVQSVAEYLRKKGLAVDFPSAGDAFAFDLAIRNPETGLFALGIECDPPRHPDLVHARDREIWRPQVLKGSLPHIHRVWSRLWLAEPSREQRRLSDAVRRALPSPAAAA